VNLYEKASTLHHQSSFSKIFNLFSLYSTTMSTQSRQLATIMLVLRSFSAGGLVLRSFSAGELVLHNFSAGGLAHLSFLVGRFTDIVRYTAMMGNDFNKALELVRQSKLIQKPLVEKHNGKWLKEMGNGAMAQFGSALDAVNCKDEIWKTYLTIATEMKEINHHYYKLII
jgi:hypothetical protein